MQMNRQDYLRLLRNVPDDLIVSVSERDDFDMQDPDRCIAGWVLREAIAAMSGKDAEDVTAWGEGGVHAIPARCARMFGGTEAEWASLYYGVTDPRQAPAIESAFYTRVDESY